MKMHRWPFFIAISIISRAASPLFAAEAGASVGMVAQAEGKAHWNGARSGAPEMADDIYSGDSLRLEAGAKLVLLYFADCREESISGKTEIKIGKKSSVVKGDAPRVRNIRCEPPGALHGSGAGTQPAALVLMGAKKQDQKADDPEQKFLTALQQEPDNASVRLAYALFLENGLKFEEAAAQYEELSSTQGASVPLTLRRNTAAAAQALYALEQGLKRCAESRACDEKTEEKQREGILRKAGVTDAAIITKAQEIMRRRLARALQPDNADSVNVSLETSDKKELLGCLSGPAVLPARLAETYSIITR